MSITVTTAKTTAKAVIRADWGQQLKAAALALAPAVAFTYSAGYELGRAVHALNDWLAGRRSERAPEAPPAGALVTQQQQQQEPQQRAHKPLAEELLEELVDTLLGANEPIVEVQQQQPLEAFYVPALLPPALESCTCKELRSRARHAGVSVSSKARKADLITAIRATR